MAGETGSIISQSVQMQDVLAQQTFFCPFTYSRMSAYSGLEAGLLIIPCILTCQGKSCTVQAIVNSGANIKRRLI